MPGLTPPPWLVDWLQSVNLWEIVLGLAALTALLTGLRAFVTKGWPWLRSFARAILSAGELVESVKGLPGFIERTDKALAEVHHEVHFNNGSSVKDATRRLEQAVARIDEGVAGLYSKVDDLAAVDDRLWTEIERTGGNPDNDSHDSKGE